MKTPFTAEHHQALIPHKHFWDHYKKDSTMSNITYPIKVELNNVFKELTGGSENLYCNDCVATMIKFLYTQFEKYEESISAQAPVPPPIAPRVPKAPKAPKKKKAAKEPAKPKEPKKKVVKKAANSPE
jgi:hypothetical protein